MRLDKHIFIPFENFKNLADEILSLAKEVMPENVIYIKLLHNDIQLTLKVSEHKTKVKVREGDKMPVMEAICSQMDNENRKPLVIEDTKSFKFNKKVKRSVKKLNIGSYLGIPVFLKDGSRFASLCAAHHGKSSFEEKDILLLEKIAKLFSYYVELENVAYKDSLTNLANFKYLLTKQNHILNNGGLVIMLDLDYFKAINDNFGHYVGDLILKEVGQKLYNFSLSFKNIYTARLGGDEFFIYIKDKLDNLKIKKFLNNLIIDLSKWKTNINQFKLSCSAGAYLFKEKEFTNITNLYRQVDKLLYEAKNQGKNRYVFKVSKILTNLKSS